MTQRSKKISADELEILLNEAERGPAGQKLRATSDEIEPNPGFARQLEVRLLANATPSAKPSEVKRPRPAAVTGLLGKLKPSPESKSVRQGRIAPLAMGVFGIAAMILLFVGMAAMINRRQQSNLNGQTPTSNVVLTDTARLAKDFTLLHTLPLNMSVPQTRDVQMAWTPDGHTLIALTVQGALAWDSDTGKLKYIMAAQDADSMAISPNSHWLAIGWGGSGILLFDLHTGREGPYLIETVPPDAPFRGGLSSITWSPDSKYLASAVNVPFSSSPQATELPVPVIGDPVTSFSLEGVIHIWDVTTGTEARTIKVPAGENGDNGWVSKVVWSPVGNTLASISSVSTLRLWDMATGKMLHTLENKKKLDTAHIEWSPDGRILAVVADLQVELWDAASGKLLRNLPEVAPVLPTPIPTTQSGAAVPSVQPRPDDFSGITSMLWSPDGPTLATADGGHIRLWDPSTGQIKLAIADASFWLAWSPDGKVLASGGWGDTGLRDIVSGEQIRTIPFQQARYMAWSSTGDKLAMTTGAGQKGAPISIWGVPDAAVLPPTSISPCSNWSVVDSPNVDSINQLVSVASISNDDAWAVGFHNAGSPPSVKATPVSSIDGTLLLHWDGKSWQSVASPNVNLGTLSSRLYSVSAVSPNDVWAVGSYSDASSPEMEREATNGQPVVLHWDGSVWTHISSLPAIGKVSSLDTVTAIATDDVWAGGYYTDSAYGTDGKPVPHTLVLHWDGKAWTQPTNTDVTSLKGWVYGLEAISSSDIWAVGLGWEDPFTRGTDKPFMLHWDGTEWKTQAMPNNSTGSLYLKNLITSAKDDVWAVGADQYGDRGVVHARVAHWDGTTWTDSFSSSPTENGTAPLMFLYDVVARASNDVWAVGFYAPENGYNDNSSSPMIIHWDGKTWNFVQNPLHDASSGLGKQATAKKKVSYLTSIASVKAGNLWAVGGVLEEQTRKTLIMRYGPGPCATPGVSTPIYPEVPSFTSSPIPTQQSTSIATSIPSPTSPTSPTTPLPNCGLAWRAVPSHSQGTLNSVVAISSNDVWAVGYTADTPVKTLVQHFDGTDWTIVPSPNVGGGDNRLNGVAAVAANDVWAVGYYGNNQTKTLTLHWDGSVWSVIASPDGSGTFNELRGVAAVASGDVWAVGGSFTSCDTQPCSNNGQTLTLHWNGSSWQIVDSPNQGTGNGLNAVAAIAGNDVWAVGSYYDASQGSFSLSRLLFFHWEGKAWSRVAGPVNNSGYGSLMALTAISSDDVWAVGGVWGGEPDITYVSVHWDGRAWTENPNPRLTGGTSGGWSSITSTSRDDVWVGGGYGAIRQWDGQDWKWSPNTSSNGGLSQGTLYGISGAQDDIWAVGGWGYNMQTAQDKSTFILHYSNLPCPTPQIAVSTKTVAPLATSTPIPLPSSTPLTISNPMCSTWSIVDSPNVDSINELTSVAAISEDDVWAVGYHSIGQPAFVDSTPVPNIASTLILHWNGKTWRPVDSPNVGGGKIHNRLTSVSGVSANDVWAVGYTVDGGITQALTMHWNGSTWKIVSNPKLSDSGSRLNSVIVLSSRDVWAVGSYFKENLPSDPIQQTLAIHWNGLSWTQVSTPNPDPTSNDLTSLSAINRNDIWAVGTFGAYSPTLTLFQSKPLLLHWNGKDWKQFMTPESISQIRSVTALASNNVWAVGSFEGEGGASSKVLHWNGTVWIDVAVNYPLGDNFTLTSLSGIAAISTKNVWAVGEHMSLTPEGTGYRSKAMAANWNGNRWEAFPLPDPNGGIDTNPLSNLNAITSTPDGDMWAVGSSSITSPTGVAQTNSLIMHYTPGACGTPTPIP